MQPVCLRSRSVPDLDRVKKRLGSAAIVLAVKKTPGANGMPLLPIQGMVGDGRDAPDDPAVFPCQEKAPFGLTPIGVTGFVQLLSLHCFKLRNPQWLLSVQSKRQRQEQFHIGRSTDGTYLHSLSELQFSSLFDLKNSFRLVGHALTSIPARGCAFHPLSCQRRRWWL